MLTALRKLWDGTMRMCVVTEHVRQQNGMIHYCGDCSHLYWHEKRRKNCSKRLCGWNPNSRVWPSNESCWAVLSCDSVYYAVQGGSNCQVCGWKTSHVVLVTLLYKVVLTFKGFEWIPSLWPFKWKLLGTTFMSYCYISTYMYIYLIN